MSIDLRPRAEPVFTGPQQAFEYITDACQRWVLFWDAMRRRGNSFIEHKSEGKPPVLDFDYELLAEGAKREHPVNYDLLRILPNETTTDPTKRPFVVVDPRAGHGPGIGGFKYDSQVGVAMRAGHPVYFISFHPEPQPGQTLKEVAMAESDYIRTIVARHPKAEKPCIIGNCQAGWAVAILASIEPDIMGPIILNGAPMSYWAGVDGKNPMRYAGGLLGGKWLATLASDLGNGKFDGAHLVSNFENLNPANTLWTKQYNLYSKIDTEDERFLEFEKWWGGFFLMNAEEMDSIVSELFIGNKLGRGGIVTEEGVHLDLRNIRSPIVVFASHGDNITPPQQALNWIIDVYGNEQAIIAHDQVIVYLLHDDIGHLGIFVSGKVAKKEHSELVGTLDLIDRLPPGLYEMVIEQKERTQMHADLEPGDYTVRLELRTVDDIRALDDGREEEGYFTAVAEVSDANDIAYRSTLRPAVRAMSNDWTAQWLRYMHPMRLQRTLFSDRNPFMAPFQWLAPVVKEARRPVARDNYFLGLERDLSTAVVTSLNVYRDMRDDFGRLLFKSVYGPTGLGAFFPPEPAASRGVNAVQAREWEARRRDLLERMDKGGLGEAAMRIVLAGMAEVGTVERRSGLIARQLWDENPDLKRLSPAERKAKLREQALLLHLDWDRAIETLADLLPTTAEREQALAIAKAVLMVQHDDPLTDSKLAKKLRQVLGATPFKGQPSAAA